jgi:hypothetical protein
MAADGTPTHASNGSGTRKVEELHGGPEPAPDAPLTTNQGGPISDNHNTLTAGRPGALDQARAAQRDAPGHRRP